MNDKNLKNNIIFYIIKQVSVIVFPMISYPYVARKLGVESLGKIEYAKSITQYFVLLSGLGISDYAIREGARIRDKKEQFNQFTTQIIAIQTISAIFSLMTCILVASSTMFFENKKLIIVFSLMIPFGAMGLNWLFGVFEEYEYIAKRTIIFQLISLILVLFFIRKKEDYFRYAVILLLANAGPNFMNLSKIRYFFKFNFEDFKLKKHLKSIFLIFGMTLASSLYMIMDTSMLGFLDCNRSVGYYSAANKLVIIIGTLVSAIRTVLFPRLSYVVGNGEKSLFKKINGMTLNIMILFAVPIAFGVFCLSEEIIVLFCGIEFKSGATTLRILTPEIVLSAANGYLIYQIFMPIRCEKKAFFCILMGAITNVLTNYILIPLFHENGAALATCISETMVLTCVLLLGKKEVNEFVDREDVFIELVKCTFSGLIMFNICMLIRKLIISDLLKILFIPLTGFIVYFICLIILKNKLIFILFKK